jgi:hypothetical protein
MMPATPIIPIVEVIDQAEVGNTDPLLCTGADGLRYYVKGQQTNRSSLWGEWICAHLAQALGLPLPPFSLVQLDKALVDELPKKWQRIGSLPAFGSCEQKQVAWLELGMRHLVPLELQRQVVAFDWWVRNADRLRGNTNLLWDANHQSLVVIDHNLAFDSQFDAAQFSTQHVFADQWPVLAYDLVEQANHAEWLHSALGAATNAVKTAPEEWLWENAEFDVPTPFDCSRALRLLERCAAPDFWRTA